MKNRLSIAFLVITIATGLSLSCTCSRAVTVPITPVPEAQASPAPSTPPKTPLTPGQNQTHPDEVGEITDAFVDGDELTYNGYVIQKRYKKVRIDYPPEASVRSEEVKISYAVLTRGGRAVMKFEGVYFGMGNSTSFGLIALLGGDAKQLVVSQDIPRGGNQWIVSLGSHRHVIYDGRWFNTGREADDMGVVDLNGDGVFEITTPITIFYELQDKMSISEIPLPEIVFKYDAKSGRYLPANPMFPDYALRSVNADQRGIDSPDELWVRSRILHVLLDYVYAGQETKGWAFFEGEYKLPDKQEFRRRVQSILKREPVHRYIYRHR